jgi:tetratricopeptide (TPR) repeat protein
MKQFLTLTVGTLLFLYSTESHANSSLEGQIIPKRIAVMPVRVIPTNPSDIFAPQQTINDSALPRQVALTLSEEPELKTFSWSEVKARVKRSRGFGDAMRLTQANLALGVDQYRNLRVADAIKTLERARKLLHEKLIDFIDPKLAADLYLHLGICLVELEKGDEARIAFARMFFYEPHRRFERGFYPRNVEDALGSAISDLNAAIPTGDPGMENEFLSRLKTKGKLDQVVTLVMRGDANSEIELRIFDLNRKMVTHFEKITRATPDALDRDALERFVSRYISCEVFTRITRTAFQKRYRTSFIETHSGYHTYARTPTRDVFHSMSVGVRAGKGVARNVAFFSDLSIVSSFQDRHRDLANRLVSVRAVGGVEYRAHWKRFTFIFSPGIEANLIPDFTVYTSANCKFFGSTHPLCQPKHVKEMKSEVLLGIHAGLGARYHATKNLFFSIRISGSVYLLPVDENKQLDFPLTAMLGLGFNL